MSDPKPPIATGFRAYRRMAVPRNASKTQVEAARKAFHAGAALTLRLVSDWSEHLPEEDAAELTTQLANELQAFLNEFDREVFGVTWDDFKTFRRSIN